MDYCEGTLIGLDSLSSYGLIIRGCHVTSCLGGGGGAGLAEVWHGVIRQEAKQTTPKKKIPTTM